MSSYCPLWTVFSLRFLLYLVAPFLFPFSFYRLASAQPHRTLPLFISVPFPHSPYLKPSEIFPTFSSILLPLHWPLLLPQSPMSSIVTSSIFSLLILPFFPIYYVCCTLDPPLRTLFLSTKHTRLIYLSLSRRLRLALAGHHHPPPIPSPAKLLSFVSSLSVFRSCVLAEYYRPLLKPGHYLSKPIAIK